MDSALLLQIVHAATQLEQTIKLIEEDPTIGVGNAVLFFLGQSPNYFYYVIDHPRKIAVAYSGKAPFKIRYNITQEPNLNKVQNYCLYLKGKLESVGIKSINDFHKLVIIDFLCTGESLENFFKLLLYCYNVKDEQLAKGRIKLITLGVDVAKELGCFRDGATHMNTSYFIYDKDVPLAEMQRLAEDEVPRTSPKYSFGDWDKELPLVSGEGQYCIEKLKLFKTIVDELPRCDRNVLLKFRDLLLLLDKMPISELKTEYHRENYVVIPQRLSSKQEKILQNLDGMTQEQMCVNLINISADFLQKHSMYLISDEGLPSAIDNFIMTSPLDQIARLLRYWIANGTINTKYAPTGLDLSVYA